MEQYLECARIASTHGIRGAVKLENRCDSPEVLADLPFMYLKNKDGSMRKLTVGQLEDYIRTVGFFHTKARHLIDMWQELEERFGGEVPRTREELTTLPGVGRKTANVVISNAFGVPAIAVDTHVFRVSNRIGLADAATVEETEKQLMQNLDEDVWSMMHHLLIFHGRRCCHARGPECGRCPIAEFCRKYQADTASAGSDGTE